MIQIPLSRIGSADEFASALEAHRAALEAHRSGPHDVVAPIAHDLIDTLVHRIPDVGPVALRGPDKFVIAEYEIIDDTPPPAPAPTLAERKAELVHSVHVAAAAARDRVLSPARARLLQLDVGDALALPESLRPASHRAAADLLDNYAGACADVERASLRALVSIEELTEASIGGWQPPVF